VVPVVRVDVMVDPRLGHAWDARSRPRVLVGLVGLMGLQGILSMGWDLLI
jgi:hypothetical protein